LTLTAAEEILIPKDHLAKGVSENPTWEARSRVRPPWPPGCDFRWGRRHFSGPTALFRGSRSHWHTI